MWFSCQLWMRVIYRSDLFVCVHAHIFISLFLCVTSNKKLLLYIQDRVLFWGREDLCPALQLECAPPHRPSYNISINIAFTDRLKNNLLVLDVIFNDYQTYCPGDCACHWARLVRTAAYWLASTINKWVWETRIVLGITQYTMVIFLY